MSNAVASETAPLVQEKEFTLEEVAAHNTVEDCWMVIGEPGERKVYDVTQFLDDHPGGPEIMVDLAGQDATAEFDDIGHSNDAREQLKSLLVGKVKGDVKKEKKVEEPKLAGGRKDVSGDNGPLFIVLGVAIALVGLFMKFQAAAQEA